MPAKPAGQGHREHRWRVIEPGLTFQHPRQPWRQRQLAQHREHRGRIGRRKHRPSSNASCQRRCTSQRAATATTSTVTATPTVARLSAAGAAARACAQFVVRPPSARISTSVTVSSAAEALPKHAVAIATAIGGFLRASGRWDQAAAQYQTALNAARRAGDRPGQAGALDELGLLQQLTGDYAAATATLAELRRRPTTPASATARR